MERPESELWNHPGVVLAVIALLLVVWSVWDGLVNGNRAYQEFLRENEERDTYEGIVELDEHETHLGK